MIIAVDFDGTLARHEYLEIGEEVPHAFYWLRLYQQAGVRLILWSMRVYLGTPRDTLAEAVSWCEELGITFFGINQNPEQGSWTTSHKAYANIYIDDAAHGCPLIHVAGDRPYADWSKIGPAVAEQILLSMLPSLSPSVLSLHDAVKKEENKGATMESELSKQFEDLKTLVTSAELGADVAKVTGGANKAAGTRTRKVMQEVRKKAQGIRGSVLACRGGGDTIPVAK